MKQLKMALFALILAASAPVFARASVPVLNFTNEPVTSSSGKPLSSGKLAQIIAKVAQGKNWIVAPVQDNRLNASLSWKNNKHAIMVEIVCAENSYSIHYRNSINMNYEVLDDQPIIHPYYNRYVKDLHNAIQAAMLHQ
jgi:hypothetical protein